MYIVCIMKYRNTTIRLDDYDYSKKGHYFVTICSRDRECIFSIIENNSIIHLTAIGKIIDFQWRSINKPTNHVKTGPYVIMPNHIHGIIQIRGNRWIPMHGNDVWWTPARGVPTSPPTLGTIIGSFKSLCANQYLKYIKHNEINDSGKIWQKNYYERIIRNKQELKNIHKYIMDNPSKWPTDENNPVYFK